MIRATLHYYVTPENINDVPLEETAKNYFIGGREQEATRLISEGKFSSAWDVVAELEIDETKFANDFGILEQLFEQTNIGDLLSTQEAQDRIRASQASHTSMSVGDIVQLDSEFYLCAIAGFEKITDLVNEVVQN